MTPLLAALQEQPVVSLRGGEPLIEQGDRTERVYVLIEGSVEVTKDGVSVTKVAEPGAVFGEMAVLLDVPHTAAVRTLAPSRFYVIDNARAFLERHPAANWHLCRLLARRLDALNQYLVDIKQQFAGHDHLGMVDGMLDLLMHRQPRNRVRPTSPGSLDPEIAD